MTEAGQFPRWFRGFVLVSVSVPIGAFAAWLLLLVTVHVPGIDSEAIVFAFPALVLAGTTLLLLPHARGFAVTAGTAGLLTLAFFAWLFGTLPGPDF